MIDAATRTMDWPDYREAINSVRLFQKPNGTVGKPTQTVMDWATGPHCPTCGFPKNGWLRSEFPVGHLYFGYLVRCPDCQNDDAMRERLRQKSQLSGWLTGARFETFRAGPDNQSAFKAAKHYATLATRGWLTIYGGFGCGKTHLLAAAVNYALGNCIHAVYFTLPDLAARLRSECGEDGNLDRLIEDVCRIDLLALDEVDTDKLNLTPFVQEQLYRIVDSRYRDLHRRTTLLALQHQPEAGGENVLGYLYSRIADGRNQLIGITAGDARPRQAEKEAPHAN